MTKPHSVAVQLQSSGVDRDEPNFLDAQTGNTLKFWRRGVNLCQPYHPSKRILTCVLRVYSDVIHDSPEWEEDRG